jgi:hypothetical protein
MRREMRREMRDDWRGEKGGDIREEKNEKMRMNDSRWWKDMNERDETSEKRDMRNER